MKKPLSILLILLCVPLLSACSSGTIYSNYKEIEQLQLVRTIGVDRLDDDTVELTVSSGKTSESGPSALLSAKAPSVSSADQQLHDYASSKQLFYSHTKYMLIGQDTAELGLGEYLGYVERSTSLRMSITLFAVRGHSAKDIMTGPGDASYDISEVMSSVERDVKLSGSSHVFSCAETARALSENGAALICALSAVPTEDIVFSADAAITAVPDGFGIIKGEHLCGFISSDDAVAACMLIGSGGLTMLVLPDDSGGSSTVTLESSHTDISPVWDSSGALRSIDVSISVNASLTELTHPTNITDSGFLDSLSGILEADILRRAISVLSSAKSLGADFLGIKARIRDASPSRFDALDTPWEDILRSVEFNVSVNASIGKAGDLDNSVYSDGSGFISVPNK